MNIYKTINRTSLAIQTVLKSFKQGRKLIVWFPLFGCITCLILSSIPCHAQTTIITGDIYPEDLGEYIYEDFEVEEGTTGVTVSLNYVSEGEELEYESNTINLGVYDAHGDFRGWGKSSFTITRCLESTTIGAIPGDIPSGLWQAELGAGFVYEGTVVHYTITIETFDDDCEETFSPPEIPDTVIIDEEGWYMGDLHCHSIHSDGTRSFNEVVEYASSIGLQFLSLTDHNAYSHHFEIPELQKLHPSILLIPGMELTTYKGHANIWGVTGYRDYHAGTEGHPINDVIVGVHEDGGAFSINHPSMVGYESETGKEVSIGWIIDDTDYSLVDSIEVINGVVEFYGISNPFNELSIEWWAELLSDGFRIAAVGGSDDHQGGQGNRDDPFYSPLGEPTTFVYAKNLSISGIIEGIREGHTTISTKGVDGARIFITATGNSMGTIGDTIDGDEIEVTFNVENGANSYLYIFEDGIKRDEDGLLIDSDDYSFTLIYNPSPALMIRAELRDAEGMLDALTGPIYLQQGIDESDEAGCSCSTKNKSSIHLFFPILLLLLISMPIVLKKHDSI